MPRRTLFHIQEVAQANNDGTDRAVGGVELGSFLGITQRRIQQLFNEGMPRISRGRFNLRQCVRWYIEFLRAATDSSSFDKMQEQKSKLLQAKAAKAAIETEILRGQVLNLEQAQQDIMLIASVIKDEFLSMPGNLVYRVYECKSVGEVKQMLDLEITKILNSVADKLNGESARIGSNRI
jgi:phage terminase Nu1 subunit (DNA packaging protein)